MTTYTTFIQLLTGKSRTIYGTRMHGTVKCYSVGVLVQQNIAKVMCDITQVSERQQEAPPAVIITFGHPYHQCACAGHGQKGSSYRKCQFCHEPRISRYSATLQRVTTMPLETMLIWHCLLFRNMQTVCYFFTLFDA